MRKRDVAIRYILLKIQSGEWKENQKIMSSRALIYRFNLNKTSAEYVYRKLIAAGILYSKERSGYYVTANDKSLFESKTKKYKNDDIKIYKDKSVKISLKDISNVKKVSKNTINGEDYFAIIKEYYENDILKNVILIFVKNPMNTFDCEEIMRKGVFSFLSHFGKIITSKYYVFDDSDAIENNYKKLGDVKIFYKHTEIMTDIEGEISCIIKSYDLDVEATVHQVFNRKINIK